MHFFIYLAAVFVQDFLLHIVLTLLCVEEGGEHANGM